MSTPAAATEAGSLVRRPRRRVVLLPLAAAAFALQLAASATFAEPPSRPNIVLILADDLGFSDLGCYGGEIRTPQLDRLAEQGLRFTQFYNCGVCVTTRSALLTGLYPRQQRPPRLRENMVTLGEVMNRAGYATSLTGKWHLGGSAPRRPIDRGFDEFYGLMDGCCNFFNPARQDPVFYNGGRFRHFAHNQRRITEFPEDFYSTDAFTDHAAATIRRLAAGERPFFVHLCYTAPHFPLHARAEDVEKYCGKYRAGYHSLRRRRHQRQQELGLFQQLPALSAADGKADGSDYRYDYDVPDWEGMSGQQRRREQDRMEVYAAMVDRLDQGVGRVLEALEASGEADNTVVMFLSDNGGCASWPPPQKEAAFREYNRGIPVGDRRGYEFVGKGWGWAQNAPFRRFKTWCYEGGIATPLIVRWPGRVAAGTITHQVGHLIDLMPTLLELAKSEYPQQHGGRTILPLEGRSLLPVLHGSQRTPHDTLCWELYGNRAIRQGDWKLVWGAGEKRWELYDLASDRSETIDLAAQHPGRVAAMARRWQEWRRRVEGPE